MQGKIALLRKELRRFAQLPHVGEVRQEGFMVGIELVSDKRQKNPMHPAKRQDKRSFRKRGGGVSLYGP